MFILFNVLKEITCTTGNITLTDDDNESNGDLCADAAPVQYVKVSFSSHIVRNGKFEFYSKPAILVTKMNCMFIKIVCY